MKAQEKTGTQARQVTLKDKKTDAVAGKRGLPAKKRKLGVKEEPESEGEEEDDEDAK
jgi:hypothetical protein